jgi:hypothetical protein
MNKRYALLLVFVTSFYLTTSLQAQSSESGKAHARYNEQGVMISIMDMNDRDVISDCEIESFVGTITGVEFNKKRQIEVFDLRVSSRKSRRPLLFAFNFPSEVYEGRLEKRELKSLPTLFLKGNRVRVVGRRCGAEGLVAFSDAVYKL